MGKLRTLTLLTALLMMLLPMQMLAAWGFSANAMTIYVKTLTGSHITLEVEPTETMFPGTGTAENPYIINSEATWNYLAEKVSAGNTYSGKYFQLTEDISVTTMVGTGSGDNATHSFCGTFDGDGHTLTFNIEASEDLVAPFRYINGATIKNLIVDGTNTSSARYNAGLVALSDGATTISNCVVNATLTNNVVNTNWEDGNSACGGFIAEIHTGNVTFNGCRFSGKILGSANSFGGFVGWSWVNDSPANEFNNCLFDPTELKENATDTKTYCRDLQGNVTYNNSYYLTAFGTSQGKQARSITAGTDVTISGLGTATGIYNVSGITAYAHGIKYDDVYYAGNGDVVSFTLSHAEAAEGYFFTQYTVTGGGTLAHPTTNSPTLTMTDADQTINVDWAAITQTFNYTGAVQTFTVPATGYYMLECYGAQGGRFVNADGLGGLGGISQITYYLTAGTVLYVYVGGQGAEINSVETDSDTEGGDGGWNGGGKGGTGARWHGTGKLYRGGAGGGGATHIATSAIGPITGSTDFTANHAGLLLIAGGGGGGTGWGIGGKGGGAAGENGSSNYIASWSIVWNNGTYSCGRDGEVSSTGSYSCCGCGGGGGGFQGGNTWHVTSSTAEYETYSGAGGSSWGETTNGINYSTITGGATAGGNGKAQITLLLQGSGTEEDPYLIPSTEVWNYLADKVNSGTNYAGKFFRLTENISVTTMIGTGSGETPIHSFCGTFDGDGHTLTFNIESNENLVAPFRYINGATIKNLIVDGANTSSGRQNSGLVALSDGATTISNCVVSAIITNNVGSTPHGNGNSACGGILALVHTGSVTFNGCRFSGKILGSANCFGGFVGWGNDAPIVIFNNCLFAPTELANNTYGTKTFYRGGDSYLTFNNSYYLTTFGDPQGKQAHSITAGTYVTIHDLGGGTEYNVSGITAYAHGIKYDDVYYAGNGDKVNLTLSHDEVPTDFSFGQYTVTGGGTLANPSSNNPSLTMTDANQTINVEWASISRTFNYTGAVQTFTAPVTGYYTLECYGAQGGYSSSGLGGLGGKSQLTYPLTEGDVLYIYVGGQGGSIADYSGHPEGGAGGWNGGGKGGSGVQHQGQGSYYSGGGGGGGATHIATSDIGPITGSTDFTSNHTNLLLIAGGGGGGLSWGSNAGGAGGGAEGGKGQRNGEWNIVWNNGTLSCGKDGMTSSTGSGSAEGCGGGGAGYQGGNTWTVTYYANNQSYSGAGGSSWGETTNGMDYTTTVGGATAGGNGKAQITLLIQGSGTEEDPYLIPSTEVWNYLANKVNSGTNYAGKFFLQTANISVTTMMGIDATGHQFGGTYDGGGYTISVNLTNDTNETTAPFRYIRGATIKNLHTTGSINTNQMYASGIVGRAICDNTIINCSSDVFITTTRSGDGTDAGLVGAIWGDSQNNTRTTLTGCVFTGKLLGSSTNCCGGLVGWCATNLKASLTIENCLYAPQERTISASGSQTFSRGGDLSMLTITNSYFSETFGGVQGERAYSVTGGTGVTVAAVGEPTATYDVSKLDFYGTNGFAFNGVRYGGSGDVVSLNLSLGDVPANYSFSHYSADNGTLAGSDNPYTLTMTNANSVIDANYIIYYRLDSIPLSWQVKIGDVSPIYPIAYGNAHPDSGYVMVPVGAEFLIIPNENQKHLVSKLELIDKTPPTGVINGLFSVSATKQVYFSQGNLQYTKSTSTWSFMEHQWSTVETLEQNVGTDYANQDVVSIFGWGTSGISGYTPIATCYQPYSTNTNSEQYNPYGSMTTNLYDGGDNAGKADWSYAANAASLGGHSDWTTLTSSQWKYLLSDRTDASQKYGHGVVGSQNGLIILPDVFVLPDGLSFTAGNSAWANSYTIAQWEKMEENGAVFLPAAGDRNGTSAHGAGSFGTYWSSTCSDSDPQDAYCLYFFSSNLNPQGRYNRFLGNSVRLVRIAE